MFSNLDFKIGVHPQNRVVQGELFGSFLVVLPLAAMIYGQAELFVFYGLTALGAAVIKTSYSFYDESPFNAIWLGILADVILAFLLLSSLIL